MSFLSELSDKLGKSAARAGSNFSPNSGPSYIEQLQAADPQAYEKLAGLMSYSANEAYGGKPQDWQAEIFAGLDAGTLSNTPKTIDFEAATRADPRNRIVENTEEAYGQVTGYRKPITTTAGTKIYANYDTKGNLTGYAGDQAQRSWLNGNQSVSGQWDTTGKANPTQYSSSGGGFFSGLVGDLGDIATDLAPMALKAAALYYGGQALGGALGGETAAAGLGDLGATDMSLGAAGEANAAASGMGTATGTAAGTTAAASPYALSAPAGEGLGLKAAEAANLSSMGGGQGALSGLTTSNLASMGGGQGITGALSGMTGAALGETGAGLSALTTGLTNAASAAPGVLGETGLNTGSSANNLISGLSTAAGGMVSPSSSVVDSLKQAASSVGSGLSYLPTALGALGVLGALGSKGAQPAAATPVNSMSASQKEYFNRPVQKWDWDQLKKEAHSNGQDLGTYLATHWNDVSGGAFNKPTGDVVTSEVKPAYAHGGALNALAQGGGSGRADTIDAKLSDGEYVMDAETVALLGDGSTNAGAQRLDQMRAQLRKQKGKALSKGKFSPNAKSPLAYLKEAK